MEVDSEPMVVAEIAPVVPAAKVPVNKAKAATKSKQDGRHSTVNRFIAPVTKAKKKKH